MSTSPTSSTAKPQRAPDGEQPFTVRINRTRLEVHRGGGEGSDAITDTNPTTLASLLWHDARLTDGVRAGHVKIQGSRPSVQQLLDLFPLPPE